MLDKKIKNRLIQKFRTHPNDTGSSEIQIAILTEEIRQLAEHLKTHVKDHSSRRGLIRKINERKKLLRYMERNNPQSFETLAVKLKIKIAKKFAERKTAPTIEDEILPAKVEEEETTIAIPYTEEK
ncbi:MAG: 30S ribosomal protein S15 [Parcubacteria group bacterium CG08_land_8_20_14_0_20_48_21]|nr:MAG: 30S ribosomal protein S15 [Parcubacteria group bacterium CG2_30_48_51]PIS33183.1 MAG: 30S ribosomal protein S15 [Parcubacteria group bacterium CG08_land_8_20_14_0_20_48_21]PIW79426.1 MAG: 30S ribosomal protein S15 [Parcubacteria group bacterium CG_4_8_14_3_um_filter_48_16]PIY77687.1 MAG: 30S ribosomal protein S15 [Parcubacteria group bacterium CG_4_10_14_0_8_um_filter_48_154]PIZ77463.1 MAG: 30S ribosomal protein S15 [bacterium CG_4_10_14_0_2_um_filter_48_144]PJC40024.1 MAG: 30S ribosom